VIAATGGLGARVETLGPDGQCRLTDAAGKGQPEFETVGASDDDLAAFSTPRGTTGRSTGARLTHDNLASEFRSRCVDYWRFTDQTS